MDMDLISQLPGFIGWKDKDFHYLGCNRDHAEFLGLKHPDDIIGLKDIDLVINDEETSILHREHDELALSGKIIQVIHSANYPEDNTSYYMIKKPLSNHPDQIIGTVYLCQKFINPRILYDLHQIDEKYYSKKISSLHYNIDPDYDAFSLSVRERECLFLILRGMTAKQISKILNLSKRTIEYYLENIKNKFSCKSKSELIISAIAHGYMNMIPSRFLHCDLNNLFL